MNEKNEENENTLNRAIDSIRNDPIPPGPPQELVDATLTKLSEVEGQPDTASSGRVISLLGTIGPVRTIPKFAAAAVLLIIAGYAVGRFSAPRPPDMEQLQAALEPAIRRNLVAQLRDDLQSGLATCYDRLSDELGRQHSQDMAIFAARTLDASHSVTSELFTELVEAIKAARTEERQWLAATIEQMELERRRDTTALASVAMRTADDLQRVEQLVYYGRPESPPTYDFENSDIPDERRNK